VFLNDNLAANAGGKGGKKNMRGPVEGSQLRTAYGGTKIPAREPRPRREDSSPSLGPGRVRPESSSNRLTSGDPRLKGLESIYLSKYSKVGSQKNIGLKKPFQGGQSRPRAGFLANAEGEEYSQGEAVQFENQRQAMVADTIDRL
jgi:hypothetical protein